jgi:hypothetical protein
MYKAFSHLKQSPVDLLFFKKRLQRFFCVHCPVTGPGGRAFYDIVFAGIRPPIIPNSLGHYFSTIIIGLKIVEFALNTAPQIPAAMGTGVPPHYLAFNADLLSTKSTVHNLVSSRVMTKF